MSNSSSSAADAAQSLVSQLQSTYSSVSTKAVLSQLGIMSALSLGTLLAFSLLRPENKRVYAPKIKYIQAAEEFDPLNAPTQPPPAVSNGLFSWFSPVLHVHEETMLDQIGLDGVTFLRVLRLLRFLFLGISVLVGGVLLPINIVYNLRIVSSGNRNTMSLFTIQNLGGNILWAHVAMSYLIICLVCYFVWYHWRKMILLRQAWFRSEHYQAKIYSRTLMVTRVPMQYRTDEGLVRLMQQLKVDGIKIVQQLDCTSIGRRLENFPDMVEKHNDAVRELEQALVKYLKGDQIGKKRPMTKIGGFLGMGGEKKDAIDHYSKVVKTLRDRIDAKRADIEAMIRKDRQARKYRKGGDVKPHGENYGFVTFKTIAEAHRIARAHRGPQKELNGAELTLAPEPKDLIWQNVTLDPGQKSWNTFIGFVILAIVCFFNTLPLIAVSLLANLSALTLYVPFLNSWKNAGGFGNWTFSLVSGVLPSVISAIFGFFLPIIMRRVSKKQGAITRSRLDRAVTQRYFAFLIISNFLIFSLIGVAYSAIAAVVVKVGQHQSFGTILDGFKSIPNEIQGTYVQQSTYWLTFFPLRGFLVVFEIAQLIKLLLLSVRRLLFAKTPRDIKEWTVPPFFETAITLTSLLFIAAVGMVYAPLAPLVCLGCTAVFWISGVVYKYQLLYVYITRGESGGRLFNVAVNRIIACAVFMQLLMILTIGLNRRRYTDVIATAPALLILLAFKMFVCRPLEKQFRYYTPTPEEVEAEWRAASQEKPTHHAEMERRFLHPALQANELFTVMVHKSQESLARDVLAEYPWFSQSSRDGGVRIKAVKEENLEFDPVKDGVRTDGDWDTQSIASTQMLEGKERHSPQGSVDVQAYLHSGPVAGSSSELGAYAQPNESTDRLLRRQDTDLDITLDGDIGQSRQYGSQRGHRSGRSEDRVATAPLLLREDSAWSRQNEPVRGLPYPPSSFASPPGYAPPMLGRTLSQQSQQSQQSNDGQQQVGYQQYWHGRDHV